MAYRVTQTGSLICTSTAHLQGSKLVAFRFLVVNTPARYVLARNTVTHWHTAHNTYQAYISREKHLEKQLYFYSNIYN